jgi:hypothetical protein
MKISFDTWPAFSYQKFKETGYLLHMAVQMIGKIKLANTPFEPHWANVYLLLTSRGLSSGLIPHKNCFFSIDIDFISHKLIVITSNGLIKEFQMESMSVADFHKKLFATLKSVNIHQSINLTPQEIPSPISFDHDITERDYNAALANVWWQIMLRSYHIMSRYHARFNGESPPIGLMWGTFDLRDARYNGSMVKPSGINTDFIRRNAMDEGQIEIGWWPGNDSYPKPAYYSFTYPEPAKIATKSIQPRMAHWDKNLHEFVLDYEHIQTSDNPEQDLLDFFESTYAAGASSANWKKDFLGSGEPV